MAERVILHCDLNNFFASVSLLSNTTLYDCPVAVCGSVEKRHGIVLAKNDIAKSFGVKTAQAVWEAKAVCKDLIILPPDYKKYEEYSRRAHAIYERYTDLIEPFGIDECWLDVSGSTMLFGDGKTIADKIRADIKKELGITASVGVSFNKIFAKLGSDMKKPDATTVISKENFKEKVWGLPASDLLFVGKHTYEKLYQAGIITVGDITLCSDKILERMLGKNGLLLKQYALGLDDSPVTTPDSSYLPKSIGKSITPDHDITSDAEVWRLLLALSETVCAQLRKKGLFCFTVTLHIRDTLLKAKDISRSVTTPTNSAMAVAKQAMEIFKENYNWALPLRSVGVRASNLRLQGNLGLQQDIFGKTENDIKQEKLEISIDKVRDKFGKDLLKRGGAM